MSRARICCSCLTATTAPGDTYCDTCRAQLPPAGFQLGWNLEPAPAHDTTGAPIPLHPDQLDLTA